MACLRGMAARALDLAQGAAAGLRRDWRKSGMGVSIEGKDVF
jgi:hypothetical protein